ncbi:MAG: response regulator [Desulfobacteraceae bacterium]|jgi:CheY-like chemotaxis protein|nr:MAG: response regulator [Desulfobacteraceae bacterium]
MQKKKILIVEDNEQNLYLETFLLEKQGYDVIQARNGQEGLDTAAAERPDLILLDIQLPVMDGYEVARRLKQSQETQRIPILAVTSYAMAGDREAVLAAGCEGYIEKPIDPDHFAEQVKRFLNAELGKMKSEESGD